MKVFQLILLGWTAAATTVKEETAAVLDHDDIEDSLSTTIERDLSWGGSGSIAHCSAAQYSFQRHTRAKRVCQGDCHTDQDCQGELKCFRRYVNEDVPGCGGHKRADLNYCYDERNLHDRGGVLAEARKVWVGWHSYTYFDTRACRPHDSRVTRLVTVRNNAVVSVEGFNGQEYRHACSSPFKTIHEYFDLINQATGTADVVCVHYDANRGYPLRVSIDYEVDVQGDEFVVFLATLRRLTGPPPPTPGHPPPPPPTKSHPPPPPVHSGTCDTHLQVLGNNWHPPRFFPLSCCRGDCDHHDDCKPGLKCFQRDDFTPVPGCRGQGAKGVDYCYDPNFGHPPPPVHPLPTHPSPTHPPPTHPPPTHPHPTHPPPTHPPPTHPPPTHPPPTHPPPTHPPPTHRPPALATCGTHLQEIANNGHNPHAYPLPCCRGDCDNDGDCGPGLLCFRRQDFTAVPGCLGHGKFGIDYCYKKPVHPAPTHPPPTYPPPTHPPPTHPAPTAGPRCNSPLVIKGNNHHPQHAFPLGCCEGDCDYDSDCKHGLKCFIRSGYEHVPGCHEAGQPGVDYCYDPRVHPPPTAPPPTAPPPTHRPPTPAPPTCGTHLLTDSTFDHSNSRHPHQLGCCRGDCNSDRDCMPGLKCYLRPDFHPVPGCLGHGEYGRDYCYKPTPTADSGCGQKHLSVLGNNWHPANAFPLSCCEGDCDKHSDCVGHLKCFQRDGFQNVPGCSGHGRSGADYCYDPADH